MLNHIAFGKPRVILPERLTVQRQDSPPVVWGAEKCIAEEKWPCPQTKAFGSRGARRLETFTPLACSVPSVARSLCLLSFHLKNWDNSKRSTAEAQGVLCRFNKLIPAQPSKSARHTVNASTCRPLPRSLLSSVRARKLRIYTDLKDKNYKEQNKGNEKTSVNKTTIMKIMYLSNIGLYTEIIAEIKDQPMCITVS